MAEFYAHERLAAQAAQEHSLPPYVYAHFPAYLVGANGPDPLFFHGLWRYRRRGFNFQKLGVRAHTSRCAQFLCALTEDARTPVQKAYVLGFFCHYALDQVFHPYVLWHCREGGEFSKPGGHGRLEEAVDSTLYLHDFPEAESLEPPIGRLGIFLIDPAAEREIDALLRGAVRSTFGGKEIAKGEFCRAFSHLRWAKRQLSRPTPWKLALWHVLETLLRLDCVITSHCSPLALPACDYMNLTHQLWFDPKAPEIQRRESVPELMELAKERAVQYMTCAQEVWEKRASLEELSALTGNRSYHSDAPGTAAE